ncbi:MAG: hypothetical protein Q9196_006293 [Gyalolechia fulgens]
MLLQQHDRNSNLQCQPDTQISIADDYEATIRDLREGETTLQSQLAAQNSKLIKRDEALLQVQRDNSGLQDQLRILMSELKDHVGFLRASEEAKRGLRSQLAAETLKVEAHNSTIQDLKKEIRDLDVLFQGMRLSKDEIEKAHNSKQTAKYEELAELREYAENMEKKHKGEIEESTAEVEKQKDEAKELKAEVQRLKNLLDPKGSTVVEATRGLLNLVNVVAGTPVG